MSAVAQQGLLFKEGEKPKEVSAATRPSEGTCRSSVLCLCVGTRRRGRRFRDAGNRNPVPGRGVRWVALSSGLTPESRPPCLYSRFYPGCQPPSGWFPLRFAGSLGCAKTDPPLSRNHAAQSSNPPGALGRVPLRDFFEALLRRNGLRFANLLAPDT